MDSYYVTQAGSGLGGFAGHRYQKGDGFFGRLIAGTVLPMIKKALPFLGKAALNTGVDIVRDVAEGQKFKESFKRRVRKAGDHISDSAIMKVKEITGGGRGRKRRTRHRKATLGVSASKKRVSRSKTATTKAKPKKRRKVGKAKKTSVKGKRQTKRKSKLVASDFLGNYGR